MSSPLDAYFAANAVADDLVPVEAHSHGAVTRMDTLWRGAAVAGGFFDAEIFGPLDGSQSRWGHIDVAGGIVIANRRVTRIPVPPIAQRMPSVVDDPAARALWHGPVNAAWIDLLGAIRLHDRLAALGAPAAFVANQAVHAQRHFEDVVARMRGEEPPPHHAVEREPGDRYLMMPCAPIEPAQPLSLLFLDDERILVQTTASCRIVDRGGTVLASWSPTGPFASSVHGDVVAFNAGQRNAWRFSCYPDAAWPDDAPHMLPLAAYDLAARKWLMLGDEQLPPWAIDETDVRDANALDLRTDDAHALAAPAIDARQIVQSRDGRFVLARLAKLEIDDDDESDDDDGNDAEADYETTLENDASAMLDAVIEVATQRPFLELAVPPGALPVVELSADHTRFAFTPSPASLQFVPALGWRIVDRSGHVGDGERWWYRLDGVHVTAWSPSGTQLAAIVNGPSGLDLVLVDISPATASFVSRVHIG